MRVLTISPSSLGTMQRPWEVVVVALVRSDPFRDFDRLAQQMWGGGPGARSHAMPLDAYRIGDSFLIQFDLPAWTLTLLI